MNATIPTPLPSQARRIFVWHQGALGDVLMAGPALLALAQHYRQASMTLVGNAEYLNLFKTILPLAAIWSSQRAIWLDLYQTSEPLDCTLAARLASFDLAVIFSPQEDPAFRHRFHLAGVPSVIWLPSFPQQIRQPIRRLQEKHLQSLGMTQALPPLDLALPAAEVRAAREILADQSHSQNLWVALAPGSGHPRKNWPLANYLELARLLEDRWQAEVWWLLGPAEIDVAAQLSALRPADHRQHLLTNQPLAIVAAFLKNYHLYVGNDSGLTHLAAAVAGPKTAAIFGPSDPVIWAPPGIVPITSSLPCAPCTSGRTISCPEARCLANLTVATVSRALAPLLPPVSQAQS